MEAEICFSHFWLAHNYCGFKNFTTMQNCIIDACFNHCWLMRTFRSYRVARELCKARCGNTSLLFHEKHISWRSSDKFKEFFSATTTMPIASGVKSVRNFVWMSSPSRCFRTALKSIERQWLRSRKWWRPNSHYTISFLIQLLIGV